MASVQVTGDAHLFPPRVEPAAIYAGNWHPEHVDVKLRIATGGAGQTGLLQELADQFIAHLARQEPSQEPFSIAWFASDTSQSFNYLAQNVADLSITYHGGAESIALRQGIADRREYLFRDHFLLVGPAHNPAELPSDQRSTAKDLFIQLFIAATATFGSVDPVRFLSRYDKSAVNIKESSIWTSIGETPWSEPYSQWYHRYNAFPKEALEAAASLGEYTLTDRGSWFSAEPWIRQKLTLFKAGGDAEDDPLLNPAHGLVGTHATNKEMANKFLDWIIREGQNSLKTFARNGLVLYSLAPN